MNLTAGPVIADGMWRPGGWHRQPGHTNRRTQAGSSHRSIQHEGVRLNRSGGNYGNPAGEGEAVRVRTPNRKEREILGTVIGMLGASRVTVRCMDGLTRMCRIRGKMKKRLWVREGDVVIVVPWDFQDEKGDVVWRYTGPQVSWLERKGYLTSA